NSSQQQPQTQNTSNSNQNPSNQSNQSTTSQTPPTRRSSFGLNFLSSFTNSIRPSLQSSGSSSNTHVAPTTSNTNRPASPTRENPNLFMSNSPTIANLHNYTSTTAVTYANENNIDPINENINDHTVTPDSHNPTTGSAFGSETNLQNGSHLNGCYSVRLTPLIDHSSATSGLYFAPVIRKIKPSNNISIGRYTEKNKLAAHAPQGSSAPIVFKSKVVSRTHALFQCNEDGQWFLKDCKSSSGTFLNHIRLSPASLESTLMPLIDGDIIQLGMDYRGGIEEVYRCVKMRCEFNKSWQRKVNQFNLEIHQKLKNLHLGNSTDELSECAICLLKLEPCQALFISPCSHSWHYKCIRPIIIKSYPQFYCPNCRSMCDLETDIEDDD
ncbi:SMAD/FHA domain-containing protein, partial [Hyphopichia burtonii NRRL Y-1933]